MSSLKSAVLFSLFSGVSFGDLQRAARHHRANGRDGTQPSARDIAYAARFAAPAQATGTGDADVASDPDVVSDDDVAVVATSHTAKAAA